MLDLIVITRFESFVLLYEYRSKVKTHELDLHIHDRPKHCN